MSDDRSTAVSRQIEQTSTPLALLERTAAGRPQHPALICMRGPNDPAPRTLTYAALLEEVHSAIAAFRVAGIREHDTIAILLPPTPEAVIALIAASAVGISFPVNLLFSSDAMATQLALAQAKVAVVFGSHPNLDINERLRAAAVSVSCLETIIEVPSGHSDHRQSWDAFLATGRGARPPLPVADPDRIGALFYTGGTTGDPKLAQLSLRNVAAGALMTAASVGWSPDDRLLCVLPLFHVAGAIDAMLAPFSCGSTVICPSIFGGRDPDLSREIWSLVDRTRATILCLVPTSIAAVSDTPIGDASLDSLRGIVTGGSPLSSHLAKRLEALLGKPIAQIYGMTETSGVISTQPLDGTFRVSAVGYPVPGLSLRLGPPGEDQPACGEVFVSGPNIFQGYLSATGAKKEQSAWVASGDLGTFCADGQLLLVGRSKDVIIRGGHNIDPALIEEAAQAHPDVRQAGAVPMPDEYAGELPVLYVALRSDSAATPEEIQSFVTERIAEPPARPKHVFILPHLPLTPMGKVARYKLRQLAVIRRLQGLLEGFPVKDIRCNDNACKQIEIIWSDEASSDHRHRAEAACHELGLSVSSTSPCQ